MVVLRAFLRGALSRLVGDFRHIAVVTGEFDAIKLHRDHPECSNMVVAEDKFKAIIPYQLKRVKNIILKKKVEH